MVLAREVEKNVTITIISQLARAVHRSELYKETKKSAFRPLINEVIICARST